jgi:hypothetical protein
LQEEETIMRKTILTALAATLIVASTTPIATAGERHHAQKADRTTANERFRSSHAYVAPAVQPDWSRYSGGISAPAGH